jgi:hypothetical protein
MFHISSMFFMRLLNFLVLLCLFSACKRQPITATPIEKPVEITNTSNDQKPALPTQPSKGFRYLKAECKAEYQDAQNSVGFKVHLRMCKDSAVWITITKMGFVGARVVITPDSVRILDHQNHRYTAAKFDTLQKIFNFPLDYNMLQSVLLANMPIADYDSTQTKIEKGWLKILQERNGVAITNFIDNNKKLQELHLKELKTNNLLQLLYQNFKTFNGNLFAENNDATITFWNKRTGKIESTRIQMEYKEVYFLNTPIEFPFNIPAKYKRF